jgi:hypothetical protein
LAKSKSIQNPASNYMPIGLFTVSYRMEFVSDKELKKRGQPKAKKEIRDDKGKLLVSMKKLRTSPSWIISKDEIESIVKHLEDNGLKDVKSKELRINLPRKCPRCNHKGSPRIAKWKSPYSPTTPTTHSTQLVYGHSTTKPETCNIGKISVKPNEIKITLVDKLEINSLGYHRRIGVYPLE